VWRRRNPRDTNDISASSRGQAYEMRGGIAGSFTP
jgi:hypothetical protein